jgi:ribA/ribD-fused uncharacterized protein
VKTINGMTLFWGRQDVFSNWHLSWFVVDGIQFNCNEQYMMYAKAMLFGDKTTAAKVLVEKDPSGHKALGRVVKPWVDSVWVANRMRIMIDGLYAKFSQNPNQAKVLLATGETTLVEASPYDDIWGVKLGADHPDILDKDKWRGLNLLGLALEEVRRRLRRELGVLRQQETAPVNHELRGEFEAWAQRRGYLINDEWSGYTYHNPETRHAWEGFRAARSEGDNLVLIKRSAIECANRLAVVAEGLMTALNGLHAAEETRDETAISQAEDTRSEYFAGVRRAVYEYRKRVPAPLMDAATLAASLS